ncbi:glycosyl transferase family 1 [Micromonospora chokoriensis]
MTLLNNDYPRVLVVGHTPFSHDAGTAMTLSNLFSGWPKDRLGQIYTAALTPSAEVCENYFHLLPRDRYLPVQYRCMRLLGWSGRSSLHQVSAVSAVRTGAELHPVMAKLYANMKAADDLSPVRITQALIQWAQEFQPDLVFSVPGSVRQMRIASAVADRCGVPLVPYFTDDWPATMYSSGELFGLAGRSIRQELRRFIQLAPVGMVISRPMAEEYTRRYGIPFHVFVNCVDEAFLATSQGEASESQPLTELVYVGALHLKRWEALRDIGIALNDVAATGLPVRLTIHAPAEDLARYGSHFTHLKLVRLGPSLASHEVPAALRAAGVLVHVESSDGRIRRYVRYSVSTKIPQYLATGRAILGYGPTEVASMSHIREANAGLTVEAGSTAALVSAIRDLCRNAALRDTLARNGLAFARRNHLRAQVAADFAATLHAAAARTGSVAPVAAGSGHTPAKG